MLFVFYPSLSLLVGLIDMLNARLSCETMTVTIAVQSPGVRLNLVDCHRELFYEKIDSYDLFIYSEVSVCLIDCWFIGIFVTNLTTNAIIRMTSRYHPLRSRLICKKQREYKISWEDNRQKIITLG